MNQCQIQTKEGNSKSGYSAMIEKNFKNMVVHLIDKEYGSLGGGKKLAELLAKDIDTLASQFFISREYVKPGQMVLNAVCKSDKPRVGKTMCDTKLTPVTVTLFTEEEMRGWINGEKKRELKKQRFARILSEAFHDYDGVLSLGDLALLQMCSVSTAGKYVHESEKEFDMVLPYRGTVHDLGPTVTHKEWIVERYLEGKTYRQIKAETRHSIAAISNYIKGYRRVVLLHRSFTDDEIPFITGMSKKLVQQYLKIAVERNWKVI